MGPSTTKEQKSKNFFRNVPDEAELKNAEISKLAKKMGVQNPLKIQKKKASIKPSTNQPSTTVAKGAVSVNNNIKTFINIQKSNIQNLNEQQDGD